MEGKAEREVLNAVFAYLLRNGAFPDVNVFRASHPAREQVIDGLLSRGLLMDMEDYLELTLPGLRACDSEEARRQLEACDALVPLLQESFRSNPKAVVKVEEVSARAKVPLEDAARALALLWGLSGVDTTEGTAGRCTAVGLNERILSVVPLEWLPNGGVETRGRIDRLEVEGYRALDGFRADLGNLSVLMAANAAGEGSLVDFLRWLAFAVSHPLPPEIDPASAGRALFPASGPERIAWGLSASFGQNKRLRYSGEVRGPIGSPRIAEEKLAVLPPGSQPERAPVALLDFSNGRGKVIRAFGEKDFEYPAPPNELALRRALDPTLIIPSAFKDYVASWRFYPGLDVSAGAALRRPVPTEPAPVLAGDGSNLSAVLFWLKNEHATVWEELELQLRSALPAFKWLKVKARGDAGTVMASWKEEGPSGELTLAELPEEPLRLLCWAVLCLSPKLPPLLCIDEPERGLSPGVLPVLAGLLRKASARSQLLVATHSAALLSQFTADELVAGRREAEPGSFAAGTRRP